MFPFIDGRFAAQLIGILCIFQCVATYAESLELLPINNSVVNGRIESNDDQVQCKLVEDALDVRISPGDAKYPGFYLEPQEGVWDLSQMGFIEAIVENTGDGPLSLKLRVDNEGDWRKEPWNTESQRILAGEQGSIKVIFGYQYGFQPGYQLDSSKVIRLLIFVDGSTKQQSFRIRSVNAGGTAGMRPLSQYAAAHTEPNNGYLMGGPDQQLDIVKQVTSDKSVTCKREGPGEKSALSVNFGRDKAMHRMSIKPPTKYWNLKNATAVRVSIRNNGQSMVTPSVRVASEGNGFTDVATAPPIASGQTKQIVASFVAKAAWQAMAYDPAKPHDGGKPGTGTKFRNDRVTSVDIAIEHVDSGAIVIDSVEAIVQPKQMPSWLGQRPPIEGDWKLSFEDSFDGAKIDLSKWNVYGPNWWGKSELTHWTKDNVVVGDGLVKLHFEKKRGWLNDDPKTGHESDFAGGYLDTDGKWKQKYGYFEARMKLPTNDGLWPAFWMMPDRGSEASTGARRSTANGGMEFDIMEHLTRWGPYRYNIAFHWDGYEQDHKSIGTSNVYVQPDEEGFITPGFLWTPGELAFYCNGEIVGRWKDDRVGNIPSYIILYQVVGGWDNDNLDPTSLPADFEIDYVRAWQREDLKEQ
ncbi:Beta-glucanase precursor [Planctomycetes bacterium CA13]|uniref:Beta-glucanase n=1 Tax=Novipirellula herctigrandis TaxID=2527986 RepID=A0A5C5YYF6_9BACT|nr:Beta-glucanase precursor [Planctomycetes bacterium CA13]